MLMAIWLGLLWGCANAAAFVEKCIRTSCFDGWQGDGWCDEMCMTPACNYDSKGDFSMSDCYWTCQDNGCSDASLGDGTCDSACNIYACGFDMGDCSYCASGCLKAMLADTICQPSCRNAQCNYDDGDCGTCDIGCFANMINNHVCNNECLTQACNYDSPDCVLESPGIPCLKSWVGNGVCDGVCDVAACRWDGGDCNCAAGCTPDMVGNGFCDAACNVDVCGYDKDDCGFCGGGSCTEVMLGNNICNAECNTKACGYDKGDCGCAAGCFSTAPCDPACSVADCHYNECTSCSPVISCAAVNPPIAAKDYQSSAGYYYQLLNKDFSTPFVLSTSCTKLHATCTEEKMATANKDTTCMQECNNADCVMSFGYCFMVKQASAGPGPQTFTFSVPANSLCTASFCEICYGPKANNCLKCVSSKYQLYTSCVDDCPPFFTKHPTVTTLCYPATDASTDTNPQLLYVSATHIGAYMGTYNEPFDSFASALAAAQFTYTIIYLFKGIHEIAPLDSTSPYYPITSHGLTLTGGTVQYDDLYEVQAGKTRKKVVVRTFYCELDPNATPHRECATERATLVYQNTATPLPLFFIDSPLEIYDIIFTGEYELVDDCGITVCHYCMNIVTDIYGVAKDEKGVALVAPYPITECERFRTFSLFTVTSTGSLLLTNVDFEEFRQQFAALITTDGGPLTLVTVNFNSNFISTKANTNAVIVQSKCKDYSCGSFSYTGGTVTLSNNGYEYTTSLVTKGFVYADGWTTIMVKNVQFTYNFLPSVKDASGAPTNSIFYLLKFKQVQFESCTFNANFGTEAVLIHINSADLTLNTANYDSVTKTLPDFVIDHVVIKSCTFTNNSGTESGGLIEIEYGKDLQNVLITGCTFSNNLVIGTGIIRAVYSNTMRDEFTKGKTASLLIGKTRVDGIIFPSRYFKIISTTFTKNYNSLQGVVYLNNLANVYFDTVTFTTNGETASDTPVTAQTVTYQLFIDNTDSYVKTPYVTSQGSCQSVVHLEKCYFFSGTSLSATSNLCKQGTGLLNFLTMTSSVLISSSTFTTNTGVTSNGSVISSNSEASMTITGSSFVGNSNTMTAGGGTVCTRGLKATSTLTVTNTSFSKNSASKGAALLALSSETVTITGSTFTSNVSTDSNGGGVYFTPRSGSTAPVLSVTSCGFKSNAVNAGSGGAIVLTDSESTKAKVAFVVTSSTFESNTAAADGATIYIDTSIYLTDSSSVSATKFTQNAASNRGAVYLAYSKGSLLFSSVSFSSNKSTMGACIYSVHSGGSTLTLQSVTMSDNNSDSMVNLADSSISKLLYSSKLTCSNNKGVCVRLDFGTWSDSSSTYSGNSGEVSGVVYSTGSGIITLSDATMTGNTGKFGGAVHIAEQSKFTCVRCTLTGNTASTEGGAAYIEQNSYLKLDTCVVSTNTASRGSALFLVSSSALTSEVINSQISSNKATAIGSIMMLASSLSITKSSIFSNTAVGDTAGISMTMSTLTLTTVSFDSQTGKNGCFIQTTTNGVITITGSGFRRCTATVGGGAIFAITSSISVSDSVFDTLTAPIGGAISNIVQCTLVLTSVKFASTNAGVSGGGFYGFQSSITVTGSSFSGFTYGAIVADKMDVVSIQQTTFENGSNSAGGAVSLTRSAQLTITKSTFSNNRAEISAGALYLDTNPDYPISATYNIKNNTYSGNSAPGAGAVYSNNVKVEAQNSYFFNNTANGTPLSIASQEIVGNAGGMMLDCLDFDICTYNLTGGVFEGNTANGNGGAIYWRRIMPDLTATSFKNNSAKYAGNVASYPVALQSVDASGKLQSYSRKLADVVAGSLTEIPPGQPSPQSLLIALIDHLGNIVKTDNNSPGQLEVYDGTKDVELSGTTKVTAKDGVFNFSEFTVSAPPNTTVKVGVASSAIDVSSQQVSKDNATYLSSVSVSVSLRACVVGESEVKNTCVICDEGKYSLDPKGNCNSCPSQAICYGNYTMVPKPGYWRSNYMTDVFWACPYSAACVGWPTDLPLSMTGYCSAGYTGNKCQSCESGYSRSGTNECGKCPDTSVNTLRLLGIAVLVIVVIVIMVKTSLNSVYRPKAVHSIYIKIFMNYLQLVMLTASFNLQWPDLVLTIFSYQESAGTVTDQVFSVDCYISDNGTSGSNVFYTKLVVFVLMPVILFFVAIAFWLLYSIYRQNYTFLKNEFVATLVILFFLIHPNLVKALFSAFACSEIDPGEYWLVNNLSIKCFDSSHVFYSLTIALPGIVIWGIGIPALCLGMIARNRLILHKLHMKLRYGFLYNGYELDCYYWEFVILYRKIAIVCCSVFLSTISIPIQALTVLLVLVVFLYIQSVNLPYSSPELNLMELRSIMVATVTIYCGLFYLTNDLGQGAKLFFFALIVLSNAYFLVLWIRCMGDVGLVMLQRNVSWVKKIRMLPELDGLEVDNLVNERYINPFFYKRGRKDIFTFIKTTDRDSLLKRAPSIRDSEHVEKYRQMEQRLGDMKYVYLNHMEEVMKQHGEEPQSDFTITPRTPQAEEKKEDEKTLEELLRANFDQD